MKFISHRGNLIGSIPDLENRPEYILNAIQSGFDCECDVWYYESNWWLGHDKPQYLIDFEFFNRNCKHLWVHAKNFEALHRLVGTHINCFFHDRDNYTITSKGIIWAYPGMELNSKTVCVMPDQSHQTLECYGICSDYIISEKLNEIRRNT